MIMKSTHSRRRSSRALILGARMQNFTSKFILFDILCCRKELEYLTDVENLNVKHFWIIGKRGHKKDIKTQMRKEEMF